LPSSDFGFVAGFPEVGFGVAVGGVPGVSVGGAVAVGVWLAEEAPAAVAGGAGALSSVEAGAAVGAAAGFRGGRQGAAGAATGVAVATGGLAESTIDASAVTRAASPVPPSSITSPLGWTLADATGAEAEAGGGIGGADALAEGTGIGGMASSVCDECTCV
jgi:hypothetical protein